VSNYNLSPGATLVVAVRMLLGSLLSGFQLGVQLYVYAHHLWLTRYIYIYVCRWVYIPTYGLTRYVYAQTVYIQRGHEHTRTGN